MAEAHTPETARAVNPLGDRAQALSQIGAADRPLGPEAALGVNVTVPELSRHLNLRVDRRTPALAAVEDVLGVALPGPSTWAAAVGNRTIAWLGPDEWLIIESLEEASLEGALREAVAAGFGAVVEQTGQRISLVVTGNAQGLLAKGTALDLGSGAFEPGTALQGFLAQAIVVFLSRDDGIELLIRTSFARYIADWLLDAAAAPLAVPAG